MRRATTKIINKRWIYSSSLPLRVSAASQLALDIASLLIVIAAQPAMHSTKKVLFFQKLGSNHNEEIVSL